MTRAPFRVLDLVDPLNPRASIAPGRWVPSPGVRQVAVVPHPAHRLIERYQRETAGLEQHVDLAEWIARLRSDDMTRSVVEWLGLGWYRSRIDDALFLLSRMWMVVREDRLDDVRNTFGTEVPLPDRPAGLATCSRLHEADLRQLVAEVETSNPVDMLLYDVAGHFATSFKGSIEPVEVTP